MRTLAYKINQWPVGLRSFVLFIMLFVLYVVWYFLLEKPLLANNHAMLEQQIHDQTLTKELSALYESRSNFIYKNALQAVPLKQVFQDAISNIVGLTMASYVDNSVVTLPAGAHQFTLAATVLNLSLFNMIGQSFATLVFSGRFDSFVTYLQTLQKAPVGIYFDSIDFNMNRYPKAEITMKVFTLKGA
ncbi:MAG: hypothetical protein V4496_01930 [Pseudomonadota bacterium]